MKNEKLKMKNDQPTLRQSFGKASNEKLKSNLVFASICPHPPIIIPSIGKEELNRVSKTVEAMKKLGKIYAEAKPETTIIISPHGIVGMQEMTVNAAKEFTGNLHQFGDFETGLDFKNDLDLVELISKETEKSKIPIEKVNESRLDHGSLVPLYYLAQEHKKTAIVPISFSYLDFNSHFEFGKAIFNAVKESNKEIAIVASGDLSHRLIPAAPAGYSPRGKEFDELLIKLLQEKNVDEILNLDHDLIEEAGECGFRSILILLGILDNLDYTAKILSYEGPFGVGYLVANFTSSL